MLRKLTKKKESVIQNLILEDLTFFQKAYCASFAGFVGSLVGNPADLALIRMQADSRLPLNERRNYTSVGNAFSRITK
jgi:solute carrier family 25 oxoglutarate transporter 11